jgi:GcrA cell cycle regulator
MEWTEEVIGRLRALWSDGHSTAEIGRRLGVSKNAVVGKAHRLDLPARPSPIRRDGAGPARPRAPRRISGPTLPPLACTRAPVGETVTALPRVPAPEHEQAEQVSERSVERSAAVVPAGPRAVPAPRLQVAARPYARIVACCWPIGEPGTRSFRFCDSESVPGKPYCGEHASLAYVRVKDRREDAA